MLSSRPRVTMRQIAECFGVSHATVSLALRNHPRISAQLRQNIQKKALEMGYAPDPMLTILSRYRHAQIESPVQAAIAWINCWESPKDLRNHREFDAYWQGASEAARKFGYHLEEFILEKGMTFSRLEKILITRNIKGILIPPQREQPDWDSFNWEHFSAVRLGRTVQTPETHLITSHQSANAMLAFRKVREKGYERIGYIGTKIEGWMFIGGFLQAQLNMPEEFRLPPLYVETSHHENRELLQRWMRKWKPQALITDRPDLPGQLQGLGYRVPEDVALAALSRLEGNVSAGIDQHSHEVGRVGLLTVISLINDFAQGVPPIRRQILVEGTWVDGPSMPLFRHAALPAAKAAA